MKLPPPEKIYEAWSALASGRFISSSPPDAPSGTAEVLSSNQQKTYKINWAGDAWSSTDNATWWQGYPGYPILAALMYRQILPYDADLAALFSHVDWNAANKLAKNDYAKALENIFMDLQLSPEQIENCRQLAALTFAELAKLHLTVGRSIKKVREKDL